VIAGAFSVVVVLAVAGDLPAPAGPEIVTPEAPAPAAEPPVMKPPPPTAVPAAGQFVAVLRPVTADPLLHEASSRIRSELAASGLPSQLVDCGEPTEVPCPGPEAFAAIALGRRDGVVEIDVRAFLPDGFELARHVRVLDRDGGQDPEVLAVRAVELLRDLRLNVQRRAPPGPPKPATDAEEPQIPLPPPPPSRWWLSTGVGTLSAPRTNQPGVWPALGATLAAGMIVAPRWATVLTFAGPFNSAFGAPVDNGQATLLQALATVELRYRFSPRVVRPFVSVLSGINYLRENLTDPNASSGRAPSLTTAWVPLFGGGGGISCEFGKRFSAGAEAEIFATAPPVLVEGYNQTVMARTGAPSIFVAADLSLAFP
jgi:hypothetical protein